MQGEKAMTTAHAPTGAAENTTWKNAPAHTVNAGGVRFAYRQLGPDSGVPLVFLHHLTAVLDDWDPRVIDGIAAKRRVITFDNRGIGASSGSVPHTVDEMAADTVTSSALSGLSRSTSSGSPSEAASRR